MYPSASDPDYGVFVLNTEKALIKEGAKITEKAVISGRPKNSVDKLRKYTKFYAAISAAYRRENFDLIYLHFISHSSPGLFMAKVLFGKRKKLVINVHGSDVLIHHKGLLKRSNEKLLKQTDLLIVPSKHFEEIIKRVFPNFPQEYIYISPSGGIDTSIFYPQNISRSNELLHLGFVSRIEDAKGWRTFLKALRLLALNDFKFKASIIGTGSEVKNLKEILVEYDLEKQVNYLGVLSQKELNTFYNNLDLFIFPTNAEESLGLVGLEAMACGIPVIGSKIAGLETFIKDKKNGLFFTPGDEKDLAEKIRLYYSLSKNEKLAMHQQALKTAQAYNKKRVAQNLFQKFKQLLIKI